MIIVGVRSGAVAGVAVALAGTVVSLLAGHIGDWWASHEGVATLIAVGLSTVVWVVVPHQPRNAAVWAMAAAPLSGLTVLANSISPFLADTDPSVLRYPNFIPAEHPASVAWLNMVADPITNIGVFVPLTFGLLLFPTGSLPGRRWRWVGWLAGGSIAVVSVAYVIANRPSARQPPEGWAVLGLAQFAVLAAMFLSIVAVLVRLRSGTGETRQQIKWVLWGGAVSTVAFTGAMITAGGADEWVSPSMAFTGFTVLIASYGIAIGRYRLYDVELVISRTIVYVSLAAIITGVYVGAVVGVGEVFGTGDEPNTVLAITTTAAVAVAFQPLRRRLQRWADRLVYGRRATPHEVLSEFAQRVAANDERLVEHVTRSLVDGTGAVRAEIRASAEGRTVSIAAWPSTDGATPPEDPVKFPIDHHGTELGSMVLWMPRGQRLADQDRVLAEQVASGMGLALRSRLLTATLEQRVVELRQSRRRLVAIQDQTRRRLERDLHDGAQQQLVALRVKLGLACTIAAKDGASRTVAALHRLTEEADRVVEDMREFARGVYPPLLEAEGLGSAITAQARRAPIPVAVCVDGLGRYERDVEGTVNVCIVEALRNAARHASASAASVAVAQVDGAVCFEVRDDGAGFDVAATPPGAGLTNLTDRIDALAGTFSVTSKPGAGTTVTGSIPIQGATAAAEQVGSR
jgi:signal transduction histidine kinase